MYIALLYWKSFQICLDYFIAYDKMEGSIWYNGDMVPWEQAQAHVLTHGLHYASSVFEGERVYDGEIFKLQEHTERLVKSAETLDFEIPYTAEEINSACRITVTKNNIVCPCVSASNFSQGPREKS